MFDIVSYLMGNTQGEAIGYNSVWKKIASAEFDVTTDSTTASKVGDIEYTEELTKDDLVFVHVRDKAGKTDGVFYGNDAFIMLVGLANGSTGSDNRIMCGTLKTNDSGAYSMNYTPNGVYASAINPGTKKITISAKYNSSYTGTIDGTYVVEVYKLTMPKGVILFE